MKNKDLLKEVVPEDSDLKELIINYVGNVLNPKDDLVTVENIIDVFADQFPEFLLTLAEENWINGYTQALNDVNFIKNNDNEKLHTESKK